MVSPMTDSLRHEFVAAARMIVVKVGTRVLTGPDGLLDAARIESLGRQFDAVLAGGRQVVLVSSGAVGAGMGRMGLARRPEELAGLQAVAAIGQSCLIEAYERALRGRGRHVGQVLLVAVRGIDHDVHPHVLPEFPADPETRIVVRHNLRRQSQAGDMVAKCAELACECVGLRG